MTPPPCAVTWWITACWHATKASIGGCEPPIAYLNELFAIAQTQPTGDAYADAYRKIGAIGYNRKGFNIVGAYMAAQIERELGRDALIQTIRDGYQAFPEAYNALVDEEMRIHWSTTP